MEKNIHPLEAPGPFSCMEHSAENHSWLEQTYWIDTDLFATQKILKQLIKRKREYEAIQRPLTCSNPSWGKNVQKAF